MCSFCDLRDLDAQSRPVVLHPNNEEESVPKPNAVTKAEAVLYGIAVILVLASLIWYITGTPGHRYGPWLLAPAVLVIIGVRYAQGKRRKAN